MAAASCWGSGDSESEPFWRELLASLKQRGLTGVRLVVSDAHMGLSKAVGRMFQGCSWQRCRVHFARNLLQTVPKAQQEMVAAALRSVFSQQSPADVEEQWDQVAAMLAGKFPRAAELMTSAREDVLAFRHFPNSHWRKLWSTNLLGGAVFCENIQNQGLMSKLQEKLEKTPSLLEGEGV